MTPEDRILQAVTSADPLHALRDIARSMLDEGTPRDDVLAVFDAVRLRLRAEGRDSCEDAVTDVMDFLAGWCSPHMKF
jgi:hypothetical protein